LPRHIAANGEACALDKVPSRRQKIIASGWARGLIPKS
jgi:hypothetical protein